MTTKSKLLKVDGPGFTAGAVWTFLDGSWRCDETSSVISWMKGMDRDRVKAYLDRRGWKWSWADNTRENRLAVGLARSIESGIVPAPVREDVGAGCFSSGEKLTGVDVVRWAMYRGRRYRVISASPRYGVHLGYPDGSGHFWAKSGLVEIIRRDVGVIQ